MSLNLEMLVGRPWGGLGGAFARGEAEALRWYPSDWRDPDAWRARARQVEGAFGSEARTRAVACLRAPSPATRAKLSRIAAGEGFVVTTGQQPGLFTGPAYTLYKAVTAIALARHLEGLLAVPVVPVFWVASEDHDWAEVDHADVIGVDNELHRIRLAPIEGAGERPLHRLPLGTDIERARDEFAQLLPQTEFAPAYLELLRSAWAPGITLGAGVQQTLAGLLGEHGLAFVDAADPDLKAASIPVLDAAAHGAERHERALRERSDALRAAGWEPQVPVLDEGVNLFVEGGAERERLYRHDGGFRLRRSGARFDLDGLRALLASRPDTVSPNVLLRPVVEAAVLPTLGYVAGPGEAAYHAQLAPLFASHGVAQPIVFPRLSAMLIETKIAKALARLALEPAALARPVHDLAADLAREDVPEDVRRALGAFRGALERSAADLADAARRVDPTLQGPIQHARTVALDALGEAERKIVQAVKRQSEIRVQQLEKARLHLYPGGAAQERVLNPFYHLARYGPTLIDALLDRFQTALFGDRVPDGAAPPGSRG